MAKAKGPCGMKPTGRRMAEGGGLTEFNEGGTHEQNPNGGIQQGTGANGQPNLVEEGETRSDDYIFSERLNVKDKYVNKFNLPGYIKGKSFAEASKAINKRFEEREDNASNSTKKILLKRLEASQEFNKLEREAADYDITVDELIAQKEAEAQEAQAEEQAAAMAAEQQQGGGQVPPGPESGLEGAPEAPQMFEGGGNIAGAISGITDMVGQGDAILDDQGKEVRDEKSVGGEALKMGLSGAAAGTAVLPGVGTAIGAGVGAVAGAGLAMTSNTKISGEISDRDLALMGQKKLAEENNMNAYGGTMSKGNLFMGPWDSTLTHETDAEDTGDTQSPLNKGMAAAGLLGSLTPMIGNIIEGRNIRQEAPNRTMRVGRTYTPEFADEQRGLNAVNQGFAGSEDLIAGATAGNLGAYRANMTGLGARKATARFDAFNNFNDINRAERKAVNADRALAQKEEVDLYNADKILDKQDRAAYDQAKQAHRVSTYEGLGSLGNMLLNNAVSDSSYDFLGRKKSAVEEARKARKDARADKKASK